MKTIVPINEQFAVYQIRHGVYAIARKLHLSIDTFTGQKTTVFEAMVNATKRVKGTRSQVIKVAAVYDTEAKAKAALKRWTTPQPEPVAVVSVEDAAKAKRSEAAKKAAATRKAKAEAEAAAAAV
jgi:hypothetical protein